MNVYTAYWRYNLEKANALLSRGQCTKMNSRNVLTKFI